MYKVPCVICSHLILVIILAFQLLRGKLIYEFNYDMRQSRIRAAEH